MCSEKLAELVCYCEFEIGLVSGCCLQALPCEAQQKRLNGRAAIAQSQMAPLHRCNGAIRVLRSAGPRQTISELLIGGAPPPLVQPGSSVNTAEDMMTSHLTRIKALLARKRR